MAKPHLPPDHKDQIYKLWEQTEPCRHGTNFWCEECNSSAWNQGVEHGFGQGINTAIDLLTRLATAAFMAHRNDQAKDFREIVEQLKTAKQQRAGKSEATKD